MAQTFLYRESKPRLLTSSGVIGGPANANGNYSDKEFFYTALNGELLVVKRFSIRIRATTAVLFTKYGNGNVLDNGLTLYIKNSSGGTVYDLTASHVVKSNEEWDDYLTTNVVFAIGNALVGYSGEWDFAKNGDKGGLLIPAGGKFAVGVDDNFTTRVAEQYFTIQCVDLNSQVGGEFMENQA
jgi:hypothetical protein